jgi:penicillin-binding protein 1C
LLLESPALRPIQAADPGAAYLIADILSDNSARTLAFGAEGPLRFDFPVACKTGTSSDFRDNWAFGYTPEFMVGVWVGNFDGAPMQQVSGVTGAAPILHDLFEHLRQQYGTSWYSPPAGLVECRVHPVTGKRRTQTSSLREAVQEKFLATHLPPLESVDDYDSGGRVRLAPEYRDWLATGDNWLTGGAAAAQSTSTLRIVFPLPGTTFYLDSDLPGQGRRLWLRAEGSAGVQWQSDSLTCVQEGAQSLALLAEGRHQLTARDPLTGAQVQTWVQVFGR